MMLALFYKYYPETKQNLKQGSIHSIEIIKNYFNCENKAELKKKLTESTALKFYEDCFALH